MNAARARKLYTACVRDLIKPAVEPFPYSARRFPVLSGRFHGQNNKTVLKAFCFESLYKFYLSSFPLPSRLSIQGLLNVSLSNPRRGALRVTKRPHRIVLVTRCGLQIFLTKIFHLWNGLP